MRGKEAIQKYMEFGPLHMMPNLLPDHVPLMLISHRCYILGLLILRKLKNAVHLTARLSKLLISAWECTQTFTRKDFNPTLVEFLGTYTGMQDVSYTKEQSSDDNRHSIVI